MSSGERPIGAAKGTQSDIEALCQNPPRGRAPRAGTKSTAESDPSKKCKKKKKAFLEPAQQADSEKPSFARDLVGKQTFNCFDAKKIVVQIR